MAEKKNHHVSCLHKKEQTAVIEKKFIHRKIETRRLHNNEQTTVIEEVRYKKKEIIVGLGTAAAGASALQKKHQAKKNPENAHKHKISQEVAVVGVVGIAIHERYKKNHAKSLAK